MKNKYSILICSFLVLILCCFTVFKLTTYFYIDSGYAGVLANQQNYKSIKNKLQNNEQQEAVDYINLLIDANDDLLKAALNEKKVSSSLIQRIDNYFQNQE